MKRLFTTAAVVLLATGCSGMRATDKTFSAHAESIRLFGYAIPEDDQANAWSMVPKGAEVNSVHVTPADWTSILGIISNIIGLHQTEIAGTMSDKASCESGS